MSPVTMAVLGVLAFKALKGSGILGGSQPAAAGESEATGGAESGSTGGGLGGGLGGLLGGLLGGAGGSQRGSGDVAGGLGGLLGGASAGSLLSGGLSNLLKDLQNAGHGQAAQSWVGSGPNQQIPPNELGNAIGEDTISALSKQTGMSRNDLLAALSRHLPEVVDRLTLQGRVPNEREAQQLAESRPAA
jgi:uncharacterized protein YidB (DUF937 family)